MRSYGSRVFNFLKFAGRGELLTVWQLGFHLLKSLVRINFPCKLYIYIYIYIYMFIGFLIAHFFLCFIRPWVLL